MDKNILCPKCQVGNVIEKPSTFNCSNSQYDQESKTSSGCDFILWKNSFGTSFSFDEVTKIISGEFVTKKCVSKNTGKSYEGIISLDPVSLSYKLDFAPRDNDSLEFQEFEKGFKKGGIVIWKNVGGATLTKAEALKLFEGESITKDNFYSKTKQKNFTATLTLKGDTVVMDFPQK